MNNKFIVLLIGKSGSGKTTVSSRLEDLYGWTQIQSYTTRLPRYPGEKGHIFVTDEEFDALQEMVAYTEFQGNRYCATTEQVEENQIYVIDPAGYEYFNQTYKGTKTIVPVVLDCDENICFRRMLSRGDSALSAFSRIEHDKNKFENLKQIDAIHIDAGKMEPDESAKSIYWIVKKIFANNK